MAIVVDFQKVRDDSREVEYIFGYPTMDRRLVIDKDSQQGRPLDGQEDIYFRKALVKIVRAYRDGMTWLEKGGYVT